MTCEGATSRGSAPARVTVVIWAVLLGLAVSTVDDGQDFLPRLLLALPVTSSAVVAAVALVDAAGNVSPVAATSFDLPWTGTSRTVTAGTRTATTGSVLGTASDGATDDGSFVSVASGLAATRPTDRRDGGRSAVNRR